jgi:hypothetical protein
MSENRKVMLEILIYGLTSDKSRISDLLAKIQRQIDKRRADKPIVRALWYIDNGEKTDYEKQDWLINEANALFYVFVPTTYEIDDKFVANHLTSAKLMHKAIRKCKALNIKPKSTNKAKQIVPQEALSNNSPFEEFEILD